MNSDMVRPEKFDQLQLVYHFTVPSNHFQISSGDTGWDVFSLDYHVEGPISTVSLAFIENFLKDTLKAYFR